MPLLGFAGKAGSGKDAAALRLELLLAERVERHAFADKLKEIAAAALNMSVAELERLKGEPNARVTVTNGQMVWSYQSIRSFLQMLGYEGVRLSLGEEVLLDATLPLDGDYDGALHVVTDVRRPNELARIRALGGKVIRVVGPDPHTGDHVTERDLSCDGILQNKRRDDDFRSLDCSLVHLLSMLRGSRA